MNKIPAVLIACLVFMAGCSQKKAYKAVLIEFMENGCSACESIKPMIEELRKEYKGLVDFRIYEIHSGEGQRLTGIYTLNGTPTLIFLDENGVEYFRLEKTIQKDIIQAILNTKTGQPLKK